ncbi:MAG: pilin [Patescibacteria group bacterium]|mgnify:CR=1 FL=1
MKKKILSFVLSLFVVSLFALPVMAAPLDATPEQKVGGSNDVLGINYGGATGLGSKDVRTTVASIINVALGLLGIVAVVIILIGGFEWMTAGGNEEKTGEARNRIFAGIIGLAIILSAYALAQFVINSLQTATK